MAIATRDSQVVDWSGWALLAVLLVYVAGGGWWERAGDALLPGAGKLLPALLLLVTCLPWWLWRRRGRMVIPVVNRGDLVLLLAGVLVLAAAWLTSGIQSEAAWSVGDVVCLVLLVPLAEEIYFRGALFDVLVERHGTVVAVAGVSLVFGLVHTSGSLVRVLAMVALSVGLCWTVRRSGALRWAVLAHALWNSAALAFGTPEPGWSWPGALLGASAIAGGLAGMLPPLAGGQDAG